MFAQIKTGGWFIARGESVITFAVLGFALSVYLYQVLCVCCMFVLET